MAPTANHDLHIGNIWIAFLNCLRAERTGGKFLVLYDDVTANAHNSGQSGMTTQEARVRIREALGWMGFVADKEFLSSDNEANQRAACAALGYKYPVARGHLAIGFDDVSVVPVQARAVHASPIEYRPELQTCYVADDKWCGVTGYIAGEDFLPSCTLYEDIWRRLGYGPSPAREFVPHVVRGVNNAKESKSDGACSILQLREAGYKPWQIISTLRECDRRSKLAGLAKVVVPFGYLTPDGVKWLEYRGDVADTATALANAVKANAPNAPGLLAYHDETKRTNRRRQESLLDMKGSG